MDVSFDLVVPAVQNHPSLTHGKAIRDRLGRELPMLTWGSLEVTLTNELPEHIWTRLPPHMRRQGWNVLSLSGSSLDLFAMEVNGEEVDWEGPTLREFLELQLRDEIGWAAIFEWHSDQIDFEVHCSLDEFLRQLELNLLWSTKTKGFIAIGPRGQ